MDEIKKIIIDLLKSAGVAGEIELSAPPKSEMGDFAFSCFDFAKKHNQSPFETAEYLVKKIEKSDLFDKIEAKGPYVNFFIKSETVSNTLLKQIIKQSGKKVQNNIGENKKILVEYPSNNTHKELHVGHLRNICIGNSLRNIYAANGYKVIPINYVNDFGAHVAKCLWGLMKFHNKEKPPVNKQKWLGEIYAEASRYLQDHPEFKIEVQEIQKKLESGDKKLKPIYARTRQWSLNQFEKIFKQLGVFHKKTFYEKDIKSLGQKMVDSLIKKGIAQTGEGGAIIVDLSKYDLNIALLRKSDGSGLYLTSDLALALMKNKFFPNVAESVHITGNEQDLYFKQLFKILELAGYKFKMTHVSFGLVSLAEGKMSSRSGRVALYEDIWQSVYSKAISETASRHANWTQKKIKKIAHLIAMAAIKFDFLKHESAKAMVFDSATALSFDGFTGPYILYAIARINSLFKNKIPKTKVDYSLLTADEEKKLILALAVYSETTKKAYQKLNPSLIAKYAFDIAKLYSDFYNKHSVLKAETKELVNARLSLSLAAKNILVNALGLLSIEATDEM